MRKDNFFEHPVSNYRRSGDISIRQAIDPLIKRSKWVKAYDFLKLGGVGGYNEKDKLANRRVDQSIFMAACLSVCRLIVRVSLFTPRSAC